MKDRVPVSELLQTVFAETGYDAATQFESLADRKLANLWKLLDKAREYDRTNYGIQSGSIAAAGQYPYLLVHKKLVPKAKPDLTSGTHKCEVSR